MKYVELKTVNGIIRGLLNKPENAKALVIMFHGFTGHKNENGNMFKQLSNYLASQNIASLRFDFYGSGDSDGDFHDMTFQTELDDAKAIIEYAIKLKITANIIVLGFSMGGAIASSVVKDYHEDIKKLVLIAPAGNMSNIARFYQNHNWYDEYNIDMGGYLLNKAFLESLDGKDLYDGIGMFKNPVLIIHGTNDQTVLPEYGKKYLNYYQNVKFIFIEGANHCFQTMKHRANLYHKILTFIQQGE